MPLPANETHIHASRADARTAILEIESIDIDDQYVYAAEAPTGRKWGWCNIDLAEISSAADALPPGDGAPVYEAPAFVNEEVVGECHECGDASFIDGDGVAYHGEPGEVDHNADADHVALVQEHELTAEVIDLADHRGQADVGRLVEHADGVDSMVFLQIGGPVDAEGAERLARILSRKIGVPITVSNAHTFEALAVVEPPSTKWSYTDEKGKVQYPNEAQETFIALCSEEGGATSDQLKAAIQGPDAKVVKNWLAMGDGVEKFGFTFDTDARRPAPGAPSVRYFTLTPLEKNAEAAA